ncbi:Golgi transport complex subunit 3 [Clydaea vesicula]|uniref:Conserved oligomeric Golgi complex subunit 3 n=1 Tax=Clydaea vesicula TaxID=447962 RepID=A0AAD5U5V0_9FUNG|nr:Golgi transport complex subunit 3 [Clydaea vesicula]
MNDQDPYLLLQAACNELPFPSKMITEVDSSSSLISEPSSKLLLEDDLIGKCDNQELTYGKDAIIETAQQFFKWFSEIEREMEQGQEEVYRSYLDGVILYRDTCGNILSSIEETGVLLDHLLINYKFVESKSKALQLACEKLLKDQTHLTNISIQLSAKLAYFNQLEPVTKLLSNPGDLVCLDNQFIPVLSKLDHCLAFINDHLHYKDTELYHMRFRQCMTRALTLIKMHFTTQMRNLAIDTRDKLRDKAPKDILNSSLYTSLFYVKFKTQGAKLKPLIAEIESRCEGHKESFLEDLSIVLHDSFRPLILRETKIELLSEICNQLQIQKKSISSNITTNYNDVGQGFNPSSEEKLGEEFIDGISLAANAVVGKILEDAQQRLVFRAQSYLKSDIEGFKPREEEVILFTRTNKLPQPIPTSSTVPMAPVLENVTDGLHASPAVLKALNEGEDTASLDLRDDLRIFSTSNLNNQNKSALKIDTSKKSSDTEEKTFFNAVYGAGEWYPTLQRTLFILGKLYQSVPSAIFEDISQEAVEICRNSLLSASNIISKKQSKLDGQLFLIKNLLMLREQISKFDTNFLRKEDSLDLSGIQDVIASLVNSKWSSLMTLGKNIISSVTPKVIYTYSDSKQAVDKELKAVCEDLILENAKSSLEPISSFLIKVSAFKLRNEAKPLTQKELLVKQNFAQAGAVLQTVEQFQNTLNERFFNTAIKMSSYLGDRRTENVLIKVIKSHILDTYQTFFDLISSNYEYSLINKVLAVNEVAQQLEVLSKKNLLSFRNLLIEWNDISESNELFDFETFFILKTLKNKIFYESESLKNNVNPDFRQLNLNLNLNSIKIKNSNILKKEIEENIDCDFENEIENEDNPHIINVFRINDKIIDLNNNNSLLQIDSELNETQSPFPKNSILLLIENFYYLLQSDVNSANYEYDVETVKVDAAKARKSYSIDNIIRLINLQKNIWCCLQEITHTIEKGEELISRRMERMKNLIAFKSRKSNLNQLELENMRRTQLLQAKRLHLKEIKTESLNRKNFLLTVPENSKQLNKVQNSHSGKLAFAACLTNNTCINQCSLRSIITKRNLMLKNITDIKLESGQLKLELKNIEKKRNLKITQLFNDLELLFQLREEAINNSVHFFIRGIFLPNSDYKSHDEERIATALGFTAHLVNMISYYLDIKLRYPIKSMSSRSLVTDNITLMYRGNTVFPLYSRGVEKFRFEYGVFLLNKNIEQLLNYLDIFITSSELRNTLPNIQKIFDNVKQINSVPYSDEEDYTELRQLDADKLFLDKTLQENYKFSSTQASPTLLINAENVKEKLDGGFTSTKLGDRLELTLPCSNKTNFHIDDY